MILYRAVYHKNHEYEGYQPIERIELTRIDRMVSELNFASETSFNDPITSHVRYFRNKGKAKKYTKAVNKELAEEKRKYHELNVQYPRSTKAQQSMIEQSHRLLTALRRPSHERS